MKTLYRTAFWIDKSNQGLIDELRRLGFNLSDGKFEAIEFFDDNENFNHIKNVLEEHNKHLSKHSRYTEEERLNAHYLGIGGDWHNGYPQPEDDYIELCYNLNDYCKSCGIGLTQTNPFRLKKKPEWGRRSIFQLNWVFDEYFVKPNIYQTLFFTRDVGKWKVMLDRKNSVLTSVVQLKIPTVESELVMDGYPFEVCSECGQKKYLPISVGGYPRLKESTKLAMFKSREYFGSGASARKAVFIDNDLYKALKLYNIKGIGYYPVF